MFYRFSVKQLALRLLAFLGFGGLIGYMTGYLWPVLFFLSLSLMVWNYRQFVGLITWLWHKKELTPPKGVGQWSHVYDGIYRRIRKYRNKQRSLNTTIRRFRDGAEALPDAAMILGANFEIVWSNRKAQKLLGVKWPGDGGQRIDNLLRTPEFSQYLVEADFEKPCTIDSPIDSEVMLELRIMPYGDRQFLMLARDVSQYHRLQQMRRDFVANVSHELKTPLTVMRGYVEMFQYDDSSLSPPLQKVFGTMNEQVTRMDKLVEQLLLLSKVEQSHHGQVKEVVNISSLASQVADECQWLNQDKQHTISTSIDDKLCIFGNESELKSAFSNLVSNAIAYTQTNGKIDISLKRTDGKVIFSVQDNGPGIQSEHLNRITERFYRVDQSRSRDTGGSGLGLAIVKHIIKPHQGELVIESTWQQGSCFAIAFPESVLAS